MNIYELKELVKIVSKLKKKEWESFKSYVDHKFKMNGKIENTELTLETLETFFLKIENKLTEERVREIIKEELNSLIKKVEQDAQKITTILKK